MCLAKNGNHARINLLHDDSVLTTNSLNSSFTVSPFHRLRRVVFIHLTAKMKGQKSGNNFHIQCRDHSKNFCSAEIREKEEKESKILTTKYAFHETCWSGYCASCFATTVHTALRIWGCLRGWFGLRPRDGTA